MKKGGKNLTLEQYMQFCQFSFGSYISRSNLNQLIEMHGFMKLHHERKSHIKECIESIDLMEPMRSTLDDDSVSSRAFLTADEISADLESIGWRECLLIRSVQTLRSGATSADEATCHRRRRRQRGIKPAEFVIVGKRPRSKRKRVSVNKLISALSSVSSSSLVVVYDDDEVEDSVPPPPHPQPEKPPPPLSPPPAIPSPPPGFFGPPPGFVFYRRKPALFS